MLQKCSKELCRGYVSHNDKLFFFNEQLLCDSFLFHIRLKEYSNMAIKMQYSHLFLN